ncbi:MAG: serine hydrolase domain-containing protein [Promethearchaeota archaeon]|jgi:CubicO group peptidase (beta-lactamase class C family)
MSIEKKREYWPTADWKLESPESVGIDSRKLYLLDKEINVRLNGVNGFLIVKNGFVIYEKYYNDYNQDKTNHLCSVTKTIISALIGIAIDKNYIKSIDDKLIEIFPEFKPKSSDYLKRKLTIRHLLTMTTGFLWSSKAYEPMLMRLKNKKNWVDYILNLPIKDRMFGQFQYNSANSHVLSGIISRTSNMSTQAFAEKYLFKPMGISNNVKWMKDPQGINIGGYGLQLRPRDMAKFGFLYINQGVWDIKQIISKDWIEESIKNYSEDYGYHVWIARVNGSNAFIAAGYGGQYIVGIPELDLVIVITSNADLRRWRNPRYIADKVINMFF